MPPPKLLNISWVHLATKRPSLQEEGGGTSVGAGSPWPDEKGV